MAGEVGHGHACREACMGRGCVWRGGMHSRGSMCGQEGGHAWQGACMGRGVHATHAPPQTLRDMVGQCAGGTHPTGMHSCLIQLLYTRTVGFIANEFD